MLTASYQHLHEFEAALKSGRAATLMDGLQPALTLVASDGYEQIAIYPQSTPHPPYSEALKIQLDVMPGTIAGLARAFDEFAKWW